MPITVNIAPPLPETREPGTPGFLREQGIAIYRRRLFEELRNEHAVNTIMKALPLWKVMDGDTKTMTQGIVTQLDANGGQIRKLLESAFNRPAAGPIRPEVRWKLNAFVFRVADWLNQVAFDLSKAGELED